MPLCSRCGKRMAKRRCPALGNGLCSLCCGLLRDKEIHCPQACPFLVRHKPYQERRILEKKAPGRTPFAEDDLSRDDRLAWLVFHLESPVLAFVQKSPDTADRDVLLAMEYARARIEKGPSLIVVPGEHLKPKNELGEAVLAAAEAARWSAPLILSSSQETYKKEEKLRCLNWVMATIRSLAAGGPEGRAYIRNLADRFSRIRDAARTGKIIQA
jgi:hypothetical protein